MSLLSWGQFIGMLAAEATIVMVLAALVARFVRPVWQRAIWHSVMVGLVALVVVECTGLSHRGSERANFPREGQAASRRVVVTTFPGGPLQVLVPPPSAMIAENSQGQGKSLIWWPGWLWLGGAALLAMRFLMVRVWFLSLRRRRVLVTNEELLERVELLAQRLGLHRAIRVTQSKDLSGPIAFGVFRAGICLPKDFASKYTPVQQEVMLAHELTHLLAKDPLWYCVADMVTALWWWHPLLWWSRRRWQFATEQAADEASLLVENGPGTLAECLVQMGHGLAQARSFHLLGIGGNGFRSSLGRRVSRLLKMEGVRPVLMSRGKVALVHFGNLALLFLVVVVASGWTSRDKALLGIVWEAASRKEPLQLLAQATPYTQKIPLAPGMTNPLTELPATNNVVTWLPWADGAVVEKLHTRWFQVDPDSFSQALREARSSRSTGPIQVSHQKAEQNGEGKGEGVMEDILHFFRSAGIHFTLSNVIAYKDRRGMLMVRASLQQLDAVEKLLQNIKSPPVQLTIEYKMAEFPADGPLASWFRKLGANMDGPAQPANRGSTNSLPPLMTQILTPAQYQKMLKDINETSGVDVLTTPKLTTLSGRQAQMKVVDVRSVVTALDYTPATNGQKPIIQPIIEQVELGPVLDVVPSVNPDGQTVSLALVSSTREFFGYDIKNAKKLLESMPDLGELPPLPIFRYRIAPANAVVWDGQTLVMLLGPFESTSAAGPEFRACFVTPTIIDAAGNTVHSDKDLPFRETGAPPRSERLGND